MHLLEEHDQPRAIQLATLNRELGHRIQALDAGEHLSAAEAQARLKQKSDQRQNAKS